MFNVFINQVTALSWSYLTIHYIMDHSKLIDLVGSNWVLFYYVLLLASLVVGLVFFFLKMDTSY